MAKALSEVALFFCVLILSGCASHVYKIGTLPVSKAPIDVQDYRGSSATQAEFRSYGSGLMGTTLGDENISPAPMALLKNHLTERLNDRLHQHTIVIRRFDVTITNARGIDQSRMPVMDFLTTLIAYPFIALIEDIGDDRLVFCAIEGVVEGKQFAANSMGRSSKKKLAESVDSVVREAIDLAAQEINVLPLP